MMRVFTFPEATRRETSEVFAALLQEVVVWPAGGGVEPRLIRREELTQSQVDLNWRGLDARVNAYNALEDQHGFLSSLPTGVLSAHQYRRDGTAIWNNLERVPIGLLLKRHAEQLARPVLVVTSAEHWRANRAAREAAIAEWFEARGPFAGRERAVDRARLAGNWRGPNVRITFDASQGNSPRAFIGDGYWSAGYRHPLAIKEVG